MKLNLSFFTLLLVSGFVLFACNQQEKKSNSEKGSNEDHPRKAFSAPSIEGDFYTIQCDSATFVKLNGPFSNGNGDPRGNVVFKYFIQDGKFTMKGWEIKGASEKKFDFDSLPNIGFKPTADTTGITYGESTPLGDFLLTKQHVKAIKDALISRKHNIVVFAPRKSTDGTIVWSGGTTLDTSGIDLNEFTRRVEPVLDCDMAPIPPKRYDN